MSNTIKGSVLTEINKSGTMHNMKENIDMDLFWRGKVCSCHGRLEKGSFKSCFSSYLM